MLGLASFAVLVACGLHVVKQKQQNLDDIAKTISIHLANSYLKAKDKSVVLVPVSVPNKQPLYSRFMVGFAGYKENLHLVTKRNANLHFESRWKHLTRDEYHTDGVLGFVLRYPRFQSSDNVTVIASGRYCGKFTFTLTRDRNSRWAVSSVDVDHSEHN